MELRGKRVAILIEDNYHALEVWYVILHFREVEATVTVIGPTARSYASTNGIPIQADVSAAQARAEDFEAIIIPSGAVAEAISQQPTMLSFIYEAIRQRRLVATIAQANSARHVQELVLAAGRHRFFDSVTARVVAQCRAAVQVKGAGRVGEEMGAGRAPLHIDAVLFDFDGVVLARSG